MKAQPWRNLATKPPLTPAQLDADLDTDFAFLLSQQEQITKLTKTLATLESRFNGQQKRVSAQEKFMSTLKAENTDLRTRVRFLENAAKLTTGPNVKN